jgi:hypothetical protein
MDRQAWTLDVLERGLASRRGVELVREGRSVKLLGIQLRGRL